LTNTDRRACFSVRVLLWLPVPIIGCCIYGVRKENAIFRPIIVTMAFDPGKQLKIKGYSFYFLAGCLPVLFGAVMWKFGSQLNGLKIAGYPSSLYLAGAALIGIGVLVFKGKKMMKQSGFSNYGVQVEDEAVDESVALDWGDWKCWKDEAAYDAVGNIDMVAMNPKGEPFSIEIKSWHRVKLLPNEVRYADGNKMKKDPIAQAERQKAFIEKAIGKECTPVLWMPKNNQGLKQYVRGVLVVSGPPKRLRDVLLKQFKD